MGDTTRRREELIGWWFQEAIGEPPRPYQLDILTRKGPFMINKARQTGISTAMACLAVAEAAIGSRKVLICSNKEDSARHILNYAEAFIRPLLSNSMINIPIVNEKGMVQWADGGEIRCFAANPAGARGYPANLVIFDEFAHFVKEIDMDEKMLEAVAPSISQLGGRTIFLSTPRGTKNAFYRLWESTPESARITISYKDCPTLKVREEVLPFGRRYWIEGMPAPFPEASFRQEFMNDFFVASDEAIPLEALRASLTPQDAPDAVRVSIGVDIGREHDATAYVVAGRTSDGHIWFLEAKELRNAPFPEQFADLEEKVTRRKPSRIVMDKTFNPQSTEDAQRRWPGLVEPFTFGAQSKIDLMASGSAMFTAGIVKCPPQCRQVVDEISNIRKVVSEAGNVQYKDKPHGDLGWAGLLALWGLRAEEEPGGVIDGSGPAPRRDLFGRGRW